MDGRFRSPGNAPREHRRIRYCHSYLWSPLLLLERYRYSSAKPAYLQCCIFQISCSSSSPAVLVYGHYGGEDSKRAPSPLVLIYVPSETQFINCKNLIYRRGVNGGRTRRPTRTGCQSGSAAVKDSRIL